MQTSPANKSSVNNVIDKPPDYAGTGRPSALSDDLQTKICESIAAGNYLSTACASVGIHTGTYYNWLDRGKAEQDAGNYSGRFFAFISAVKKAEADREAIMAQRVIDAAMPGERKRVTKVATVNGVPLLDDDGNPVTYDEVTQTGGDWLAAMTFLERRYPERWARPDRGSQVSSGNTYNINIEKAIIDAAGKFDAIMNQRAIREAQPPLAIPDTDTGQDITATTPVDVAQHVTPDVTQPPEDTTEE